jgi:hypothetical protein
MADRQKTFRIGTDFCRFPATFLRDGRFRPVPQRGPQSSGVRLAFYPLLGRGPDPCRSGSIRPRLALLSVGAFKTKPSPRNSIPVSRNLKDARNLGLSGGSMRPRNVEREMQRSEGGSRRSEVGPHWSLTTSTRSVTTPTGSLTTRTGRLTGTFCLLTGAMSRLTARTSRLTGPTGHLTGHFGHLQAALGS